MSWKECEAEKLIKRDSRARERVTVSLSTAERFLHSAQKNLEIDEYEMVQLAAYNSVFHSAIALLFSKGYTERSHSCLGIALDFGCTLPLRLNQKITAAREKTEKLRQSILARHFQENLLRQRLRLQEEKAGIMRRRRFCLIG